MREIKDYLHLYMGQKAIRIKATYPRRKGDIIPIDADCLRYWANDVKPILRPLSSMTEDEAEHLAWLCMDGRHRSEDYAIDKDEIQIEFAQNDGGTLLDKNIQIYIGVSCRCWEGYIAITEYGEIIQCEEDSEKREPIDNVADKVRYLLSKGFDLFNLIPDGLAIDSTNTPT